MAELAENIGARFPGLPAEKQQPLQDIVNRLTPSGIYRRLPGFLRGWFHHEKVLLILNGLSGTGKTLAAQVIANETGMDVYRIDLSFVVSKYIGETEKNLAALFDRAENRDWILFFDEADELFGARTSARDEEESYARAWRLLSRRIEEHRGIVMLSSAPRDQIDKQFARHRRYYL